MATSPQGTVGPACRARPICTIRAAPTLASDTEFRGTREHIARERGGPCITRRESEVETTLVENNMVNVTKVVAGLLLVVAVVLGIFAWMIARQPSAPPVATQAAAPAFAVVVAARALPAGQPIKATDLDMTKVAQSPVGAFSSTSSLIGRVPLVDIGAGQPIVDGVLLAGLAGRLEPGERAIAIKVDELAGVGAHIHPGDWVDVFMLLRRDGQDGEIARSQARLLLSKVRVLAYGRTDVTSTDNGTTSTDVVTNANNAASPTGASGAQPAVIPVANAAPRNTQYGTGTPSDPLNARSAVIAVPVQNVDAIALADASGRIVLALRNPTDTQVANDAAFGTGATVLVPTSGQMSLRSDGATHAAAGLALDDLAGERASSRSSGAMPLPVMAQAPLPKMTPVVSNATSPRAGQSVEIIRGNKRETVGW